MAIAIRVEHLSKEYRLGIINNGMLYKDIQSKMARWLGRPDPHAVIGTDHFADQSDRFWALKDICLDIEQGDRVGIIGRNGAGKSTLLKILSRITAPTEGIVKIKGKVASLLEVGTGFHGELTGRENIYLNGAILGMKKREIDSKLDQIIDFSEIEQYIDTPVKRYSSGMYVRLAFAVAAHLNSEILLADEVLAVGDASFQKKALGKMQDLSTGEGRTVLFVSHNMTAIAALCKQGVFLEKGKMAAYGNLASIINLYNNDGQQNYGNEWRGEIGDENAKLMRCWVKSLDPEGLFDAGADIEIGITVEVLKPILGFALGFKLWSGFGYELAQVLYDDDETEVKRISPGVVEKRFCIPRNTLTIGDYEVVIDIGIDKVKQIVKDGTVKLKFHLENTKGLGRKYPVPNGPRGYSSLFKPFWTVKDHD